MDKSFREPNMLRAREEKMGKYAISQQGACSLKILSDTILLNAMLIERAGWRLADETERLRDGIGIYGEYMDDLIDQSNSTIEALAQISSEISHTSKRISEIVDLDELSHPAIVRAFSREDYRRKINLYFVLEATSQVSPIHKDIFKTFIEELVPELNYLSEGGTVDFYIQTMVLNESPSWLEKRPTKSIQYRMPDFSISGKNHFGDACILIDKEACRLQSMDERELTPIIVFVLRSNPSNYFREGLRRLLANNFYQVQFEKYVYFWGDSMDQNMYMSLLGDNVKQLNSLTPYTIRAIL